MDLESTREFCRIAVKQIKAQEKLKQSDISFIGLPYNNNERFFSSTGSECPRCGTEAEKALDPTKYLSHYAVECPKCNEGMYVQIINEFTN